MDLENKVIGFQFVPERSICNHTGFYQDSGDKGDAMERDMFDRKESSPSVRFNCKNCSTIKGKRECLCCQDVEAIHDFNPQGIFVLSQAIILLELTRNLMVSISICFCNQIWFQNPAIFKIELFATVANVYKLSSVFGKCFKLSSLTVRVYKKCQSLQKSVITLSNMILKNLSLQLLLL